jgi:hypothetical protein
MLTFFLILNPLLYLLERNFPGIRIGLRTMKTAVLTHADYVMIFVKAPADIQIIEDLRKGNVFLFDHTKIQSYGSRLVGLINVDARQPILCGSNRTGFQIFECCRHFKECHLIVGDSQGQSPGQRRVQSRCISKPKPHYVDTLLQLLLFKIWHTEQIFPNS